MRKRTVAIAGCGTCGLATALLLKRAGERVVMFERFLAPQPIGSGLMIQPTGLAVLDQLGLGEHVLREGARINRLYGRTNNRVVLDVRYAALGDECDMFGIGLHRASLFNALYDAILGEGMEIRTGHTVIGSRMIPEGRCLETEEHGLSEPFDLVVDALGTRSTLAPSCGRELSYGALWATLDWPESFDAPCDTLSQRYHRSSKMVGVLPIGRARGENDKAAFFWSLKGRDLAHWKKVGLDEWLQVIRRLWPECEPLLCQIRDPAQLTFARYAHRTLRRPTDEALVHLGDAWHSASPQLGQGANMALLDAWALSCAMGRNKLIFDALRDAIALRRWHVKTYQWLTWLLTPVYQSDSHALPFLRDRILGPISQLWPITVIQAAMVAGLVASPLRRLGLEDD